MPNHVYNRLIVTGDTAELGELVSSLRSEENDPDTGDTYPIDFERDVPMPAELAQVLSADEPSQEDVRAALDWRREHWGTKWNANWPKLEGEPEQGALTYTFATAWRPADAWLGVVAERHPELRFVHEYYEEMAHFAGRATFESGRLVADQELDPYEVEWADWTDDDEDGNGAGIQ
jgi:hypothetical protein